MSSINRLIIAQSIRTLHFAGPISVLFLLAKGLSIEQILMLSSVLLVSSTVFEIPTGVFADAHGRRTSMIVGSFLSVVGWSLWLFANTFIGFAAVYVVLGLANALWSGADQALIYDELEAVGKKKDAQKVFSRYNGAMAGAFAIAALVGGWITYRHTLDAFYLTYWLTLASSIIGLIVTFTIRENVRPMRGDGLALREQNAMRRLTVGLRYLKTNAKLLKITLFSVFTLSFVLFELYQVYFSQAHVPESWYGYVLALSSVLVGLAKWNAHRLEGWVGVETSLALIAVFPALIYIVVAFAFSPGLAVILFLVGDSVGNMRDPLIEDYQNRHINGRDRATVLSTISLLTNGYVAVMLPVIGWIAGKDLSLSFLAAATIVLLAACLFRIRAADVVAVQGTAANPS
jgi:MFS family permease